MEDAYNRLLDATITHLQQLKSAGVQHVAVSPETLASLRASSIERCTFSVDPPVQPTRPVAEPPARRPGSTTPPTVTLRAEPSRIQVPTGTPQAKAEAFADLQKKVAACHIC